MQSVWNNELFIHRFSWFRCEGDIKISITEKRMGECGLD